MKSKVVCIIHDAEWGSYLPALKKISTKACAQTLKHFPLLQALPCTFEIAVAMGNDAFIQGLNSQYRAKNKPTNVLAFPSSALTLELLAQHLQACHGAYHLGDIAISGDTVTQEAQAQEKQIDDHLTHLLIHATLHLLGFDHADDDEAEQMESVEVALLKKMEINNPYL